MPAITKKEELTEDYLVNLKRKDLLNLCKEHGIKCVGKNSELIEKLLELKNTSVQLETPHVTSNFNHPPMTPQKVNNIHLPIVETPNTSALIKSIVQSARKTGLNSSPIRIPFALSPMALKLTENKLNFSPMKAKEPSQVIKEAFFEGAGIGNEEEISLPFDNKRPHEESGEYEDDEDRDEERELHKDKREKLEEETVKDEQMVHELKDHSESVNDHIDINEYINSSHDMSHGMNHDMSHDINHDMSNVSDSISSLDSLPPVNSSSTVFPPTNFSTDLLKNLKDPEFASPELSSAPDCRVSRSEGQDRSRTEMAEMAEGRTLSKSASGSSSNSSSTKNHPLLPSGIVKLLEKKRQEKEQQQQQQQQKEHLSATSTTTTKKKFDLKESLKRPLNYKPHIGSIPKKDF